MRHPCLQDDGGRPLGTETLALPCVLGLSPVLSWESMELLAGGYGAETRGAGSSSQQLGIRGGGGRPGDKGHMASVLPLPDAVLPPLLTVAPAHAAQHR